MIERPKLMKLKDLCSKIGSGATPKGGKEAYKSVGIPLIRSQNVLMNSFSIDGLAYIDDIQAEELKNVIVQPDDILLNITGDSVARVCQAPKWICPARVNQHVAIIRPDSNKLNATYLRYYLVSPKMQDFLLGLASSGATRQALTKLMIEEFEVPVPERSVQERIANILGNIDRKIEINNQINETLESMAKAIFKEWFVDFGPVKAKAEGKKPFGMDDETASLFPDTFEDSELGSIPKGWEITPYLNDVSVIGGGTPKTSVAEYWNGNIPWFSVVDSPNDGDVWVIDTEKKITDEGLNSSSTKLLEIGTSIITARGTVGKIALVGTKMAMNQSCYALKSKNNFFHYYYFLLKSLVAQLKGRSHGSVFDTITTNTLASLNYSKPENQVIQKFEESVSPLLLQIKNNLNENKTLSSLRELLLPKLISGEIQLNEVVSD
jgi:type I restriction enzyme, S subunit